MVEPIMYSAIGFLIAGFLVIGFIPLVHARAERLALAEAERALATTRAEFSQVSVDQRENAATAETRRVELLALRAQAEALKGQIESYDTETQELEARLRRKTTEAAKLNEQLAEERGRAEHFAGRATELDRTLLAYKTEAEVLGRRVEELTTRLDEQGRFLVDREFTSDELRNQAASAQRVESEVRAALAEVENRHRSETQAIRAEKASLEAQIRQSGEERAKLESEISAMKRDAETTWAKERMESALLRERINDIAGEVARLTAALEGPTSSIAAIVNGDSEHSASANGSNGTGVALAPQIEQAKGTLADRIRALQSRASTIPQPAKPSAASKD
jgi:chromosome segregation ATPase